MVQIFNADTGFVQAVANRLSRKASGMLEPVEAFLFSRSDQPAIAYNRRRRISVIRIYPQTVHLIRLDPFPYPFNLWLSIASAIAR